MTFGLRTILLLVAVVLFVIAIFADDPTESLVARPRRICRRLPDRRARLRRPHVRHIRPQQHDLSEEDQGREAAPFRDLARCRIRSRGSGILRGKFSDESAGAR